MRLLETLPEEGLARRLADHLVASRMAAHVEQGRDGWQIWVEHDDHLEAARSALGQFLANPLDPKFDSRTQAERLRRGEQKRAEQLRKNYRDVRTNWASGANRATPVMIGAMALCLIATLVTQFGNDTMPVTQWLWFSTFDSARENGIFAEIFAGQVWRILTPIFMHGSVIHLVFNLSFSFWLGGLIERQKGSGYLLWLVVASGIVGNLTQAIWGGHPAFLGFSGVAYALFGFAWIRSKVSPHEGIGVDPFTVGMALMWLVLGFTGMMPIANGAHVGGLVVGVVAGYAPRLLRRR
jgi:GlpG protein